MNIKTQLINTYLITNFVNQVCTELIINITLILFFASFHLNSVVVQTKIIEDYLSKRFEAEEKINTAFVQSCYVCIFNFINAPFIHFCSV